MTKEEVFKKYHINESHSEWNIMIDNWMSVELFRVMHNGELPNDENQKNSNYVYDFLDNFNHDPKFAAKIMSEHSNWGSLYLTAKRLIYMDQKMKQQ